MKLWPSTSFGRTRLLILLTVLITPLLIRFVLPIKTLAAYEPQEGDILFQRLYPFNDLVKAIEGVSGSKYSHCGVVLKDTKNQWAVIEALGEVKMTPLDKWIAQGVAGKFDIFRLKDEYLNKKSIFIKELKNYLGVPYDMKYKLGDEAIYCSELIYRAFQKTCNENMGELVKLGDMNWQPYQKTIEKYEEGPVPLERLMITPVSLAKAKQLKKKSGSIYK